MSNREECCSLGACPQFCCDACQQNAARARRARTAAEIKPTASSNRLSDRPRERLETSALWTSKGGHREPLSIALLDQAEDPLVSGTLDPHGLFRAAVRAVKNQARVHGDATVTTFRSDRRHGRLAWCVDGLDSVQRRLDRPATSFKLTSRTLDSGAGPSTAGRDSPVLPRVATFSEHRIRREPGRPHHPSSQPIRRTLSTPRSPRLRVCVCIVLLLTSRWPNRSRTVRMS